MCPGVALLDLRLSLPHDINSFTFSKYARQHVQDRQMGLTKAPIRLPFLAKQTAQDNTESVEVFKLILQYIFETSLSEAKRQLLGSYIVQKGLSHAALRDEIYVQLCNQTMGDPKRHGGAPILKAWELLAICLSAFPPSYELAKYLLKYVSDSAGTSDFNVICQQKLLQCFGSDLTRCRVYPPTLLEC
jgi:myosin-15